MFEFQILTEKKKYKKKNRKSKARKKKKRNQTRGRAISLYLNTSEIVHWARK